MATRMILKNGDPQLRKHCHEVKDFNPRLHMLLDDMRQTLAESNGVGLAAPQVGVLRRAVIVLETNVPDGEEEYMIELINPTIVETAGEQTGAEGVVVSMGPPPAEGMLREVIARGADRAVLDYARDIWHASAVK